MRTGVLKPLSVSQIDDRINTLKLGLLSSNQALYQSQVSSNNRDHVPVVLTLIPKIEWSFVTMATRLVI